MKHRNRLLGLLLSLLLICASPSAVAETAEAEAAYFDYVNIVDENKVDYCGALYSDSMLLADARTLSTDLTKLSVTLATAAYDRDEVVDLLTGGMGFSVLDNGESYTIDRSLANNDMVAYTIAEKDIAGYRAYCVVVRGTGENAEWFSDFNLGKNNGGDHLGFHLAARQVWTELEAILSSDGSDAAHRIVLLAGHSRGAAVSNILGAWLNQSSYVQQAHMFCYTFACPAVSRNTGAHESYKNIHNFNNSDDLITVVPLSEWGYARYGKDHPFIPNQSGNALRRYEQAASHSYHGISTAGAVTALSGFVPNEETYFDPVQQFAMLCVANSQAGEDSVSVNVLVGMTPLVLSVGLLQRIDRTTNLHYVLKTLRETSSLYEELVAEIADVVKNYDPEKGPLVEQLGERLISYLLAETGIKVNNLSTLGQAKQQLEEGIQTMNDIADLLAGVVDVLYESDGDPLASIADAHDPTVYNICMNSQFFGYKGWTEGGLEAANLAGVTSVGEHCFHECRQLETLTGLNTLEAIGNEAFEYAGLRGALELPETLKWIGDSAFYVCGGLDTLSLPAGLKHLGGMAFAMCEGLKPSRCPSNYPSAACFTAAPPSRPSTIWPAAAASCPTGASTPILKAERRIARERWSPPPSLH